MLLTELIRRNSYMYTVYMTIILPNHNLVFRSQSAVLHHKPENYSRMVKKNGTGRRESGLYMYLHVHVHQKIYADMNVFMDRIHLNKDKYWNVRTIQHH